MGGGPQTPIVIKDEDDELSLPGQLSSLDVKDTIEVDINDSGDELPVQDVAKVSKKNTLLMRELKALHGPGWKPPVRPDYTKKLDEPLWDDSDEEDSDYEFQEQADIEVEMDDSDDDNVSVKSEEDSDVDMK